MCDIRKLRKDDFEQFIPIVNAFTRHPRQVSRAEFEAFFDATPPCVHTFVYEVDGKLHGTAKIFFEPKFSNNLAWCGHVEDVAVLPESRNQGIARAMVDYLVKFCWDNECYKIVLECDPGLVPLYEKSGFKTKGREMAQYRNP